MKNKEDNCVKRVTIVCSLCACLAGPAAFGQGLISNGTFDSDASGWTAQNIASLGGYIGSKGNPGGYFMLDSIPSVDTDPTLSQTINGLIIGATYRISGEFRMERDWDINSPVYSFGVSLNGVNLFEGMRPTDWNRWNAFDVTYTASSASVLLAIAAQRNGTGVTYGIDNISMQQVPEPAVTTLLMIGAMFLMRIRHKGDTAALPSGNDSEIALIGLRESRRAIVPGGGDQ